MINIWWIFAHILYKQCFFQFYSNFLQTPKPPFIITALNCLSWKVGLTYRFAFVWHSKFSVFLRISIYKTYHVSLASNFVSKFVAYWKKRNSHRRYSPRTTRFTQYQDGFHLWSPVIAFRLIEINWNLMSLGIRKPCSKLGTFTPTHSLPCSQNIETGF